MKKNVRELRALAGSIEDRMRGMLSQLDSEDRVFTDQEEETYNALDLQLTGLLSEIRKLERYSSHNSNRRDDFSVRAPNFISDEEVAFCHYLRTGDTRALWDVNMQDAGQPGSIGDQMDGRMYIPSARELRAWTPGVERRANDTIMNITTSADGGATVPTGLAPSIAARRNGIRLSDRLGIPNIPGKGTTVNAPYENADPNQFAATSEQDDAHAQNYERDAPTLGAKPLTLSKKTKKLELTEELLDDEDANLLAYIGDHIGRAIGLTHNAMLLTEVAANGTSFKTFAGAAAIAAGEPENIAYNDTVGFYLDEMTGVAWVMRPATHGAILGLTGNSRLYNDQSAQSNGRNLLNFPILYASAASAIGASAKSVYFGNWRAGVGMREDPALRFIRDPYTVDGMVILKYSFRAVYGVLIAGAVGFGVHPTA